MAWFILRLKISAIQYCIVSFGLMVVSVFLKFTAEDNLSFGNFNTSYGFLWLLFFKVFSASWEIFHFYLFESCFEKIEILQKFRIREKIKIFKYFLIFTELQPLAFATLSKFTDLLGDSFYTSGFKGTFIISFFYTIEILCFLVSASNIFSVSDFKIFDEKSENPYVITEISSTR